MQHDPGARDHVTAPSDLGYTGFNEVNHHGKLLIFPMSIHKKNRTSNGFNLEKNNVCTSFGNTNNFGQFGLKKT